MKDFSEIRMELVDALFDFVKRVSKHETVSETEVQVLPEVARVLKELLGY